MVVRQTVVRLVVAFAATVIVAALLLGVDQVKNIWATARAKATQQAREQLIDPSVELDQAVSKVTEELPRDLANLKAARQDCQAGLVTQAKAVSDLQEGLRLVSEDLKVLAQCVRLGRDCRIRGTEFDTEKARQEASRLLAKRDQYNNELMTRTEVAKRLRSQDEQLASAIAAAEESMRTFSAKSQEVASKIALLKVGQRIEAMSGLMNDRGGRATESSLRQLDRDLDRRLQEQSERSRLRGDLGSGDEYLRQARDTQMLEELGRVSAPGDKTRQETLP